MFLIVPNSSIAYRLEENDGTWQKSYEFDYDGNRIWCWTFRCESEIRQMHPTIYNIDPLVNTRLLDEENDREIFGETLDEEIPHDLWDMINGL